MQADDDARHGINPFEIALWVLAVVLIVGSAVGFYSLATALNSANFSSTCDAAGNCTTPPIQYLYQLAVVLAPGLVSGGVLCAAIALALRAIDFTARRRTAAHLHSVEAVPAEQIVTTPGTQAPVDPSYFMRPRD